MSAGTELDNKTAWLPVPDEWVAAFGMVIFAFAMRYWFFYSYPSPLMLHEQDGTAYMYIARDLLAFKAPENIFMPPFYPLLIAIFSVLPMDEDREYARGTRVVLQDIDGKVMESNAAAAEMLGRTLSCLLPDDRREETAELPRQDPVIVEPVRARAGEPAQVRFGQAITRAELAQRGLVQRRARILEQGEADQPMRLLRAPHHRQRRSPCAGGGAEQAPDHHPDRRPAPLPPKQGPDPRAGPAAARRCCRPAPGCGRGCR